MTTDNGDFEGIDIEVAGAIAKKLGLELQVDDMDFDAALLAAQNGKADMVMAGVTVTDERLKVMDFSDTYAEGIQSIIVPEGSDIATADDLSGKAIGTQRGTTGYLYCTDDFGEENVIAYDDGLTAVQALNNGQVDAVVIDNAPAKEFVAANPGLKIFDTAYAQEDYAIGVAKGNTSCWTPSTALWRSCRPTAPCRPSWTSTSPLNKRFAASGKARRNPARFSFI